jgi:hypothetical protein
MQRQRACKVRRAPLLSVFAGRGTEERRLALWRFAHPPKRQAFGHLSDLIEELQFCEYWNRPSMGSLFISE